MKEINATRGKAMKEAREAKSREKMQAAGKAYTAAVAKILNEEQLVKFKKIQADMAKARKSKGGKGKGDKGSKSKSKKKKKSE